MHWFISIWPFLFSIEVFMWWAPKLPLFSNLPAMHPFISPLFLSSALVHSPAVFLHFYQVHSTKWTTSHQVHCTYSSTLPQGLLYHLQWQRRNAPCNRNVCIFPHLSLLQPALSIVHPSTPPAGPVSSCVHCLGSPSFTKPSIIRHNSVMNGYFKRISRWQKQAIIPMEKSTFSLLL